jgi:trigger factor
VLTEQKLNPIARPVMESLDANAGEDLTYVVTLEIFPNIELTDFSNLTVTKLVAEITDKDIEDSLQRLKEQFATWEPKTAAGGAAAHGDRVIIDFTGFIDGKEFENGAAKDYSLDLGSNSFIPGFEDGLFGVTAGSERDLKLKFPADYGSKDLAGKDTVFKVKVHAVKTKVVSEPNADFAKKIGIEDGDVSKVTAKIRENLESYANEAAETKIRDGVLEKLLELNNFDVPELLISREQRLVKQELQRQRKHDLSETEVQAQAKKRVAIALLLNSVIKQYDIKPDENRIKARLAEIAKIFGQSDYIREMYSQSQELMQNLINTVLCDQATDLLLTKATVNEQKTTFKDLANMS